MYWGQDIVCTQEGYKTFDIIKSNLKTALKASGHKCYLWTVLDDGFECSCKKDDGFDVNCVSCYGTGIVMGYKQFKNDYIVIDPFRIMTVQDIGITLGVGPVFNADEIEVFQKRKPFMLSLKEDVLEAYAEWNIVVPAGEYYNIQYDRKDYIRDSDEGSSLVKIEGSIDDGLTWYDVGSLPSVLGLNVIIEENQPIKVRVTLLRESSQVRSPLFFIGRVKADIIKNSYILMSRTRNPSDLNFEKNGVMDREGPVGLWTVQDFIIKPVSAERQRGSMIEMFDSPFVGLRYELYNPVQSFFKDHTFRQVFEARVISRDREIFWKIF